MGDVEDPPKSSGDVKQQGWLGSLLGRRANGPTGPRHAGHAAGRGPFNRFSAITEESTSHPHHSSMSTSSNPRSESPTRAASPAGAANLSRKAPIPRQSDPLGLLQASSALDRGTSTSSKGMTAASSVAASSASTAKQGPLKQRALGDVVIGRPSTAVKVSEEATKRYMNMAEEDIEENLSSSKHLWDRGIIHPLDRRYRAWWYVTVIAAAITGWLVPFRIAYLRVGYQDAHIEGATGLEIALLGVFGVDIIISFLVAYYDHQGLLMVKRKNVALHYLRHRFLLDLITTIPFDAIALAATGAPHDSQYGRYLSLLGWLKIGRMYRVAVMFQHMSFNLNFGLLALTLFRNLTFSFFLLHWAACTFWFIALQEGQHANTWVGQEQEVIGGKSTVELYVFSFYWAIVTFATLGYGDVTPSTTAEILFTIVYIAINLVVWAYILGTITLLVTKQDEETGAYRARMSALTKYCTANNLSPDLKHTMAGLLRLHMSLQNESLDDEQVLAVYPTTIRRKILRQLYSVSMHDCYLFNKCGVKFLDALMLGARVELFLPKVEIVSALDHVNELYIVMAGHVELVPPSSLVAASGINSSGGGAWNNSACTTYGPGGDSLAVETRPYRVASLRQTASGAAAAAAASGSGVGGLANGQGPTRVWPFGAVVADGAARQQSLPGTTTLLPRLSTDLGRHSAASLQQQQQHHQWHGANKVLDALPGVRRLQRWWSDTGIGSDGWRREHEQLQQDKQSLARVSRAAALARTSHVVGGRMAGVRVDHAMPAIAMRKLDSRSRAPLHYASVSSNSESIGAGSVGMQGHVQDPAATTAEASHPILGPGDCFAEVAYFTEVPKAEAVRSLTVCRVLVIPRSTYNAVARDFPLSARQVLENLKTRAAQLVAHFLSPEVAAQYLAHADMGTPRAAAAAAAATIAAVEDMGIRPMSATAVGLSPFEISQQQQQQQSTSSDTTAAAPTAATVAAAAGEAPPLSPPSASRDRDKPFLSSMSMQLQGRYGPPMSSTSLPTGSSGAAAAAAAAAAPGGEGGDDRQARALTRFTSLSAAGKWRSLSNAAAGLHKDGNVVLESTSADAVEAARQRRSSVDSAAPAAAAAAWEGGLPAAAAAGRSSSGVLRSGANQGFAAGHRNFPGGRGLGTMSMVPAVGNARVARALEGMAATPEPQQQQQQGLGSSSSADGNTTSDNSSNSNTAGTTSSSRPGANQRHPKIVTITAPPPKVDPVRGLYSDEQLQAAAAAAAERLTLQQQSMLFDLLKIRQLVNKAAAKFDQQRLTAFLDAAAAGEVDVVQDMLRQGMSPNTADYDGRTALMIAAYKGHKDVVLNLLFVGADTALKDARGFDVMIEAARGGHREVLDVLTRSGAKTGISAVLQSQLLCKATYEGKLDRLSHLLKAGCQPDAHDYDGQTALHVAAADGNLAAARVLVSAGASPTLKDRWRYSPLDLAHKVGAAPLVGYFESVVPPEDAAAAADGWKRERTEAALAAARYGDIPALTRLLDRGCPVDAADYDGRTLLHVAVTNKQGPVVQQLLAAGANPNATNSAGSSPLLEAAMNGSSSIQSDLMAAGARLNLPSTEEAALLSSVLHQGRHDQLLALLAAGANPAAADYDSRTPLHIAASVGDIEALSLLSDAVADISIERLTEVNWAARDRWGDTPLQEAQRAGHETAAAFLKQMEEQQHQHQQQQQEVKGTAVGVRQVQRTFHSLKR